MQNSRERNPALQQRSEPLPGPFAALTATIENSSPQPAQTMPEGTELIQIARDSMVLVVTLNGPLQPFTDLRCRLVHPAGQFCFQTAQLRHHPLVRRFAPYDETAVAPSLPTVMREAQERKGLRLSLAALFPNSFGMLPELRRGKRWHASRKRWETC